MKIAFIYDRFSLNKKVFYLDQLFDHSNGLTGSESSCIFYALEMAKLGHEVSFYSIFDKHYTKWNEINIYHIDKIRENHKNYDILYSWNEPNLFQTFDNNLGSYLKIVNQQLNDFNYCWSGYDNYVDIYTSPSHTHAWMLSQNYNLNLNKFLIVPNGVHLDRFKEQERTPGKVVYISSPDRGLHWLLMSWEKIKKAVPHANLRICYELNNWHNSISNWHYYMENIANVELYHRSNYIKYALEKLKDLDVYHQGSNSYNDISDILSKSEVLAYFCDPVSWTEGFSVSTLESCAAGLCPIISDINSLGEIYKEGAWVLPSPVKDHLDQYIDAVIEALTNKTLREEKSHKAQEFAKKYDYKILAQNLSIILENKLKERKYENKNFT